SPQNPEEETRAVGADQVESYLAGYDEEAWFRPRQPPEPPEPPQPPTPQPTQPPVRQPTPAPPDASATPDAPRAPAQPTQPPQSPEGPQVEQPAPPPPRPEVVPPTPVAPTPAPQAVEPPQAPRFTPFAEGDRMTWPVQGETLMPFSIDALVYDPTLDQFRTNDNLRIAAAEGDPVRAGAHGRVVAIGRNVRQGNYVTIDHGNGWVATYGQLMENIMVSEGDIVDSGQIIGGVGQPSIFGSANGTHVQLRVERDNVAINPYDVLAERENC
ncbi:MAG: M23 family metallopeptidase, partial [Defluviitaleaceae bacterium]|nr:M23 family metallopeptidase [Defluviitaleaceae bacterium]